MNITTIQTGPIQTNTYLIKANNSIIVIDPGDEASKIIAFAQKIGSPIKYVLLTHTHYDHTGAVETLQKNGAKVYMHQKETDYANSPFGVFGRVSADELISSDTALELDGVKIDVLHTPGHSVGSVCYVAGKNVFSGDTLFLEEVGRCDLPGGDFEVLKQSLKKVLALPKDYAVLPGHGPASTIAHEIKNNRYAR